MVDDGGTNQDSNFAESPEITNCGPSVDVLKDEKNNCAYSCGSKRLYDDEGLDHETMRSRTSILESDTKPQTSNKGVVGSCASNDILVEEKPFVEENRSCNNFYEQLYCTVCCKATNEIHKYPLLKVIVCEQCKCVIKEKSLVEKISFFAVFFAIICCGFGPKH